MSLFFYEKKDFIAKSQFFFPTKTFFSTMAKFLLQFAKNFLRYAKYFFDKTKYSLIRQNFHRIEGFYIQLKFGWKKSFWSPNVESVCAPMAPWFI